VNSDQTVSVRKITLGPGDATNIAVAQGVAVGDVVVIDGADRLKDGAKILVRQGVGAPAAAAGAPGAPGAAAAPGQAQGQQHQHRRGNHGQGADQSGQPPSK